MASLGPLKGTTSNFGFNLVNFDWVAWHDYERENWTVIDALLASFIGINNVSGQWANNTAYLVGKRVVDSDDGTIWEVLIAHTSAAAGTFAVDRAANPTFLQTISPYTPIYKGVWANNVIYSKSDFVSDPNRYFIANTTHTSPGGGTIDNDLGNWDILIDLTTWSANLANTDAAVAANTLDIATNTANIATNVTNIATNVTNIATNAVDIAAITSVAGANIISTAVNYTILPADLTDYDSLVVLVDTSTASRSITLPTPANYTNKTIHVIANVITSNRKVTTKKSGGGELHTGYAKGDFISLISDGTNDIILDEYVTVYGQLSKTADQALAPGVYANIFAADYSEDDDIGKWYDAVTNHRLDIGFDCRIQIIFVSVIAALFNITPILYKNGVAVVDNGLNDAGLLNVHELDVLSTDALQFYYMNNHGTITYNVRGNAGKTRTRVIWRVIKRLR